MLVDEENSVERDREKHTIVERKGVAILELALSKGSSRGKSGKRSNREDGGLHFEWSESTLKSRSDS